MKLIAIGALRIRDNNVDDLRTAFKQLRDLGGDLLVVAGQIFEYKPYDVITLYNLVADLNSSIGAKCNVLLVDPDLDAIENVLANPAIRVISRPGEYNIFGLTVKYEFAVLTIGKVVIGCDMTGETSKRSFGDINYPGSIIQQSKSDGLLHGGLIWNIGSGSVVDKREFNIKSNVHVAIQAKDNKIENIDMTYIGKIKGITLHYASCTDEWIRTAKEAIAIKYGHRVDYASHEISLEIVDVRNVDVHEVFIKTQNHPELVGLHREMYARFASPEAARNPWKLIYMSWKNLLCYGDANHIDFSAMKEIMNLIGQNMVGKSNIIDILIFGLFDVAIRGDKKSLPLLGEANYELIIEFEVATRHYVVSRNGDRNGSKVQLYMRENGAGKWTNISAGTVAATYAAVNNLIGDERELLRMCVANQDRIILKDAQDILNEFKYYLKLDCFDKIEEHVKELMKDENREIRNLEKVGAIPVVITENVADINTRIEECTGQLRKLDTERFTLGIKPIDDLARYLDVVRGFAIGGNMRNLFTEKRFTIPGVFEGVLMEFADPGKLVNLESKITSLIEEQARIKSGMLAADPREAEIISEMKGIDISRNYETDLVGLRNRLDKIKNWIDCAERGVAPEVLSSDPDLSKFDFSVLTKLGFSWDPQCKCCAVNAEIASKIIMRSPEVTALIGSLMREKSQCEQRIAQIGVLKSKIALLSTVRSANATIANKNAELVRAESEVARKIAELKQLRDVKIYHDNYLKLVTLLSNANDNLKIIAQTERNNQDRILLQTEIRKLEDMKKKITEQLAYNESISRITTSLARSREKVQQYKDYIKLLGFKNRGLGHYIFAQHSDRIESAINRILRRITDFNIKFTLDPFDIIVIRGEIRSPIAKASGFQRFIIDLCFRLSLIESHPYVPRMLIIDENFGCMDSEHISNTAAFFKGLSKTKVNIILISHIGKLQAIGVPIKITRDRYSRIQFGVQRTYNLFTNESEKLELRNGSFYCALCNKVLKQRSGADKKHIESKKHSQASARLMQNISHK